MSAILPIKPQAPTPDTEGAVYDAIADAMATAATYSETATRFAEIRDARGLAYAVRSASAALMTAAGLIEEIRPPRGGPTT